MFAILDFFRLIWDFIANAISSMIQAIVFLTTSVQMLTWFTSFMPAILGGAVLSAVAILVMRFMLFK